MNPRPTAQIKASADDFVVEELPAYAPSGQGSHLFVRFTKRNLTTEQAMAALASALDTSVRDAGCAGMKDKVAVTTQTISLAIPPGVSAASMVDRAHEVVLEGITVHEAVPHGNKLKPGHLAGNRFSIVVRGIERSRLPEVAASFERMGREGVRNDFGSQRLGGTVRTRSVRWRGLEEKRRRRGVRTCVGSCFRRCRAWCSTTCSSSGWPMGPGPRRSRATF